MAIYADGTSHAGGKDGSAKEDMVAAGLERMYGLILPLARFPSPEGKGGPFIFVTMVS